MFLIEKSELQYLAIEKNIRLKNFLDFIFNTKIYFIKSFKLKSFTDF